MATTTISTVEVANLLLLEPPEQDRLSFVNYVSSETLTGLAGYAYLYTSASVDSRHLDTTGFTSIAVTTVSAAVNHDRANGRDVLLNNVAMLDRMLLHGYSHVSGDREQNIGLTTPIVASNITLVNSPVGQAEDNELFSDIKKAYWGFRDAASASTNHVGIPATLTGDSGISDPSSSHTVQEVFEITGFTQHYHSRHPDVSADRWKALIRADYGPRTITVSSSSSNLLRLGSSNGEIMHPYGIEGVSIPSRTGAFLSNPDIVITTFELAQASWDITIDGKLYSIKLSSRKGSGATASRGIITVIEVGDRVDNTSTGTVLDGTVQNSNAGDRSFVDAIAARRLPVNNTRTLHYVEVWVGGVIPYSVTDVNGVLQPLLNDSTNTLRRNGLSLRNITAVLGDVLHPTSPRLWSERGCVHAFQRMFACLKQNLRELYQLFPTEAIFFRVSDAVFLGRLVTCMDRVSQSQGTFTRPSLTDANGLRTRLAQLFRFAISRFYMHAPRTGSSSASTNRMAIGASFFVPPFLQVVSGILYGGRGGRCFLGFRNKKFSDDVQARLSYLDYLSTRSRSSQQLTDMQNDFDSFPIVASNQPRTPKVFERVIYELVVKLLSSHVKRDGTSFSPTGATGFIHFHGELFLVWLVRMPTKNKVVGDDLDPRRLLGEWMAYAPKSATIDSPPYFAPALPYVVKEIVSGFRIFMISTRYHLSSLIPSDTSGFATHADIARLGGGRRFIDNLSARMPRPVGSPLPTNDADNVFNPITITSFTS